MARRNNVPVGANVVESVTGRIDKADAWTDGRKVTVTLYHDMCSQGYKTDYQPIPTAFVLLHVEGERTSTWQYSGKRYLKGAEHYQNIVRDLRPYLRDVA